jgi:WD40 repeat protein
MSPTLRGGLLLIGLATPAGLLAAGPAERGPMPHLVDLYGDPLPEGAVVRLGSVRLRHAGLKDFTFVPGGNSAVTVGADDTVRWWDLPTGRQTRDYRLPRAFQQLKLAVSSDGTTMAGAGDGKVLISEFAGGRAPKIIQVPDGYVDCLAYSPDGTVLAVGIAGFRLAFIDLRTGKVRDAQLAREPEGGHRDYLRMSFSRDGRRLAVTVMDSSRRRVAIYEVAEVREVFSVPGSTFAEALSPDGTRLAVGSHPNEDWDEPAVVRLFDVKTGKETPTPPRTIDPFGGSLEFTPDGKAIAARGSSVASLIDAITGKVLRRLPTGPEGRLSPDGRWVVGVGWHRLRVWNAATGRESFYQSGHFDIGARAVSADGRVLAVEAPRDGRISLLDTSNGRPIRELRLPDDENYYNLRFAFAPDGRRLAATRSMGVAWIWDVGTGQSTRPTSVWMRDEPAGPYHEYMPSPDGQRLAAMVVAADRDDVPRRLEVWDASTGRLIHRHTLGLKGAANISTWVPDGSAVAIDVAGPGKELIRLVDVETGRVGTEIVADESFSIASDGRLAASWRDGRERGERNALVWDIATGQQILRVPTGEFVHRAVGVAAAARALLIADGRRLRVLDLVTGQERVRWELPDLGPGYLGDHPVWEVQVLPGDRAALTPIHDGSALIWDLTAFPPSRLSDKHGEPELMAWWKDLAGADAAKAYASGWKLSEAPAADLVAFLRARLRPATAIDADEVRKRVADLDSPTFATREAASRRLQQMGPAVLPYLRKRPAAPSAEATERLQKLDERLSDPVPPAETLRALRAIAVLERVGTGDARQLLNEVARGAADASETRAARAALVRMQLAWPVR